MGSEMCMRDRHAGRNARARALTPDGRGALHHRPAPPKPPPMRPPSVAPADGEYGYLDPGVYDWEGSLRAADWAARDAGRGWGKRQPSEAEAWRNPLAHASAQLAPSWRAMRFSEWPPVRPCAPSRPSFPFLLSSLLCRPLVPRARPYLSCCLLSFVGPSSLAPVPRAAAQRRLALYRLPARWVRAASAPTLRGPSPFPSLSRPPFPFLPVLPGGTGTPSPQDGAAARALARARRARRVGGWLGRVVERDARSRGERASSGGHTGTRALRRRPPAWLLSLIHI